MALKVALQTSPAVEFVSLATSPQYWDADACSRAADEIHYTDSSGPTVWSWFKGVDMQQVDLADKQQLFCESMTYDEAISHAWETLRAVLMEAPHPSDVVHALPARPELLEADTDGKEHAACVEAIKQLVHTWPTFVASNKLQGMHGIIQEVGQSRDVGLS